MRIRMTSEERFKLITLLNNEIKWCKEHVVDYQKCGGCVNGECACDFVAGLKHAKKVIESKIKDL